MHFLNGGVVCAIPFPNRRLRFFMVSEFLFDQLYFMRGKRKNSLRYLFLDSLFVCFKFLHLAEIILILFLKDEVGLFFKGFHGFEDLLEAWTLECTGTSHNPSPKVRHNGPRVIFLRANSTSRTIQGSCSK